MNEEQKELNRMSCREIIEKVNENVRKLIQSEEEKWKVQRKKLRKLLEYHTELLRSGNIDKPTSFTLHFIDLIKQWRTENLNTKENISDPRYKVDVASLMCTAKVKIMAKVLPFELSE